MTSILGIHLCVLGVGAPLQWCWSRLPLNIMDRRLDDRLVYLRLGDILLSLALRGTDGLRRGEVTHVLDGPISVLVCRCTCGCIVCALRDGSLEFGTSILPR